MIKTLLLSSSSPARLVFFVKMTKGNADSVDSSKMIMSLAQECHKRCLYSSALWILENSQLIVGNSFNLPTSPVSASHLLVLSFISQGLFKLALQTLEDTVSFEKADELALFLQYHCILQTTNVATINNAALQMTNQTKQQGLWFDQLLQNFTKDSLTLSDDPFNLLMRSMLENNTRDFSSAAQSALRSIEQCPYILAAWEQLGFSLSHILHDFGSTREHFQALSIPKPISKRIILYLEGSWNVSMLTAPIQPSSTNQARENEGKEINSYFDQLQNALIFYNQKRYIESKMIFQQYLVQSKRIEGMDCYSDILFLDADEDGLTHLASSFTPKDYADDPICYHIMGNLYALCREYERAAVAFYKAARKSKLRWRAWILAGQQYLELRNPEASIDCFLHATEANPKDFRGWFGLGQIYELLGNKIIAITHYHRAFKLSNGDEQILIALGDCYMNDGQLDRALAVYESFHTNTNHVIDLRLGFVKSKIIKLASQAVKHFELFLSKNAHLRQLPIEAVDDPMVRLALETTEKANCDSVNKPVG